jgi:hypothetical protein
MTRYIFLGRRCLVTTLIRGTDTITGQTIRRSSESKIFPSRTNPIAWELALLEPALEQALWELARGQALREQELERLERELEQWEQVR